CFHGSGPPTGGPASMTARRSALCGLLVAIAATASGQTFPFQLLVTQAQNATNIQNGATLTFLAAVGGTATAQLQATYNGTGQATITSQPGVFGSAAFKASINNTLPISLTPGASVVMTIQFTPTSATGTTAQITLPYVETLSSVSTNTGSI